MNTCQHKVLDNVYDVNRLLELFSHERNVFLLESSLYDEQRGRYSFIGFDPFDVFASKGKVAFAELKKKYVQYSNLLKDSHTPFNSGMVGYFGYDHGLAQENIQPHAIDDLGLPDCWFGFYDCVITVDHFLNKIYVSSSGSRAKKRLDYVVEKIKSLEAHQFLSEDPHKIIEDIALKCNFTKDQYKAAVKRALDYIGEGDIYQVNLSQRFQYSIEEGMFDLHGIYRTLKELSPSQFGSFLDCGAFQIISSSPERFLKLMDGFVQTRPMKGTRPRGINQVEDENYKKEIIESVKDKAELLMITDLERNDLGKVCEYGSINVKTMRDIEAYKTVYQATSEIHGTLQKDKDVFDLLEACFPGGSITGCPKIRSMEIIEELEPTRRGIYTGSLGYISFNGDMDMNILIRTLLVKDQDIYFQVGGGIVADSTPEGEYEETLTKARALKRCLSSINIKEQDPQKLSPIVS